VKTPSSTSHQSRITDHQSHPAGITARELANELRSEIRGEVRFDSGSRALYAADASNYRQVPIGVVIPRDVDDVISTIAVCRKFGAPILSRGGGTSLAGQCCNVAVVLDMTKYFRDFIAIDPKKRLATARPGIVLDDLRARAAQFGLTFGPDPATHNRCTIGGMIGNNSCGVHSVMAQFAGTGARTSDNLDALEILTYRGLRMRVGKTSDEELEGIIRNGGPLAEIYGKLKALRDKYAPLIRERFPKIPRRVSGYNLDELLPENGFHVARALAGTEGTCVTILEATLHLIANPKARSLLVLGFPDVFVAGDHCPEIMRHKPIGMEGFDGDMVQLMKEHHVHTAELSLLPEGKGWLMVEFGGESKTEADDRARELMNALQKNGSAPAMKLYDDPAAEKRLWEVRESALGVTAFAPNKPDRWPGWEDSAVPPERIGAYLRDLKKLFQRHDYDTSVYGHFGQGLVHCRLPFEFGTNAEREKMRAFLNDAADLVVSYGGSLSGEHGDGQARAALLPKMFGEELVQAFREFKSIWDPDWKMNPGKVVDPKSPIAELRLGQDYNPRAPKTHFHFRDDNGSFAHATVRCVGVGLCRRERGGTMCPSYMVTREEKHSTRARAHLLFEMLRGEVIGESGWRDEAVMDALDLCLSCKGCKGDCPVHVDMATYKAEFLSHYYKRRLRPIHAYAFGLIHVWARLTNALPFGPRIANFFSRAPIFRDAFKALIGIAPQRNVPPFAKQSFKEWFRQRDRAISGRVGVPPADFGVSPKRSSRGREKFAMARTPSPAGGTPTLPDRHGAGFRGAHATSRAGFGDRAETHGEVAEGGSRSRARGSRALPAVILWPDTFNNYFHPNTAQAAVEVLESAGFRVIVPEADMCCGRPLYDYGMLDTAERWLRKMLVRLQLHIRAGTPIVVLEPSCYAVFKDELINLLPNNQDAQRLSKQTFLFAEFLEEFAPDFAVPKLHRKAFAHIHCHQKALKKSEADEKLLRRVGLDLELPDNGCCGMAGAFGFEADHYETSMKVGEYDLLPHVRNAAKDTLLIADGFSCREQISQTTERRALHIAQVLRMAQLGGERGGGEEYPEQNHITPEYKYPSLVTAAAVLAGIATLAGLWLRRRRKREKR